MVIIPESNKYGMNLNNYALIIKRKSDSLICWLCIFTLLCGLTLIIDVWVAKKTLFIIPNISNSLPDKEYLVFISTILFLMSVSGSVFSSRVNRLFQLPQYSGHIIGLISVSLLAASFYIATVNINLELGYSGYFRFICWGLATNVNPWKELFLRYFLDKDHENIDSCTKIIQAILFVAPNIVYLN